ncbi:MAG: SDR family oxidoreductase [Spongiibacteraceae bacterium]
MKLKQKPIAQQVIVITGATSGIGLATAKKAAQQGAQLMLIARNKDALEKIAGELSAASGQVIWAVADVADEVALRSAATAAREKFGRIDTWINNAGVSIFGYTEEVSRADQRRLFETNFWGVVNGSLIAVEHLRERGGTLINLGSELSDAFAPLQGIYTASKHAVKAFTESLRAELEHEHIPISVTLIKPAAIATLFVEHAKNYMDVEPKLPAPIYAPELVADAILTAAHTPQRNVFVGGAAKLMSVTTKLAPTWVNRLVEHSMFKQQRTTNPEYHPEKNSLHEHGEDMRVRGETESKVQESCPYTQAAMHPLKGYAVLGACVLAVAAVATRRRLHSR